MEVTEIKVNLVETSDAKLKAFVTLTFCDAFVVRDLKVIDGKKGLFVAMPSVKVTVPCPKCRKKNPIRSHFCNECGEKLEVLEKQSEKEDFVREEHRDIAHPINAKMRDYIQSKVLEAYRLEVSKKRS